MILCISIVSHNQGLLIDKLLEDCDKYLNISSDLIEIVITKNIPEPSWIPHSSRYNVKVIDNLKPKGFGQNHNCAFESTPCDVFLIVNPDIRLTAELNLQMLSKVNVGLGVYSPLIISPTGQVEDFFRERLTPWRLLRRRLGFAKKERKEWLAGMFLIINRETFRLLQGFDENFFMYVEDCDLSLRLQKLGGDVQVLDGYSVIHDAQRQSSISYWHFYIHLRSLLYFWKKCVFSRCY